MTFKSEIIFVRVLAPFLAGIITFYLFADQNLINILLTASILLLTCLITTNIFYKSIKAYHFKKLIGAIFYLFCFAFSGLLTLLHHQTYRSNYFANSNYDYLKVWINDEPQLKNNILRFEVIVTHGFNEKDEKQLSGKLLIALKVDSIKPIELNYGDELIITGKYQPVEPAYNDGEFDFKAWLAVKNIYQQTFINQNQLVKLNENEGNKIIKFAIQQRQKQVAIYRKLIKNDEAFAVASTLVLGYRADLSKETLNAYSKTGTIHALSVSGAHVGIIFFLLNAMLSFLDRKKFLKIIKLVVICFLIWYYALLTGFSSSVLRSAIMITIFILAKSFNKSSNNYNILAFTAFILLFYNPFYIWDVGFQLSFISVFGLIYLQPKIYKWLYFKNKWVDKLWSAIALSLAAQLATFPLSVFYFHQFPVYFLLGNIFILIPLIVLMYFGIGILILKVYFLAPIFEWIISFTNKGLKFIADLPFSGITSIWLNTWQLLLLSSAIGFLIYALVNYQKKLLFFAICLLIAFQTYAALVKTSAMRQQKISFFTLRKNYAVAFIKSNKAILITDLTADDKNFQFFVEPALDKLQVEDVIFINWKQDTVLINFIKAENQIRFLNYKILMVDEKFNYKKIENTPKVNSVWLHNNTRKNINELRAEVIFKELIIDASNKDYMIKTYENDAKKFKLKYHTLKKNNSYLINLK